MTNSSITLLNSSIIKISGSDTKKFLQGLITNDINKASNQNLIYSAMLSPKGRFLYDFIIFENDQDIYLDCASDRCDEIVKKFGFYKLRMDVTIEKIEDIIIAQSFEKINGDQELFFISSDPRSDKMGYRIYLNKSQLDNFILQDTKQYHEIRIKNKIPEGEYDLTFDKSLILEFGFNDFNAVDYEKGCYVGQELTARTHHLGQVRKQIFLVSFEGDIESDPTVPDRETSNLILNLKNTEITHEQNKIGKILSVIKLDNINYSLALLKSDAISEINSASILGHKLTIIS